MALRYFKAMLVAQAEFVKLKLAAMSIVLICGASLCVAEDKDAKVGAKFSASVEAAHDYLYRTNDLIFNVGRVLTLCSRNGACAGQVRLTQNIKSDTIELNGQKFLAGSKRLGWLKSFSLYSVDDGRIFFKAVPKDNEVLRISEKDFVEGNFVKKISEGQVYFDFVPNSASGCASSELGDICPWHKRYNADSRFQRELDPWGLINEYEWLFTYMRKVDDVLTRRMKKNLPLRFDMYAPAAAPGAKNGSFEILEDADVIEKLEIYPYQSGGQKRIRMVFRINWAAVLPQDTKISFDKNAQLVGDAELVRVHFKGRQPFWFLRGAWITKDSGCRFTFYGDLCPVMGAHRFTPIGPKSGWAFKRLTSENPFD